MYNRFPLVAALMFVLACACFPKTYFIPAGFSGVPVFALGDVCVVTNYAGAMQSPTWPISDFEVGDVLSFDMDLKLDETYSYHAVSAGYGFSMDIVVNGVTNSLLPRANSGGVGDWFNFDDMYAVSPDCGFGVLRFDLCRTTSTTLVSRLTYGESSGLGVPINSTGGIMFHKQIAFSTNEFNFSLINRGNSEMYPEWELPPGEEGIGVRFLKVEHKKGN